VAMKEYEIVVDYDVTDKVVFDLGIIYSGDALAEKLQENLDALSWVKWELTSDVEIEGQGGCYIVKIYLRTDISRSEMRKAVKDVMEKSFDSAVVSIRTQIV